MKTAAFVPIKLNNERLPGKNLLKHSDGKLLLSCILETLSGCTEIDEVYVFCSDPSIGPFLPAQVKLIRRDLALNSDTTTANDLAGAFAETVSADLYVMAHATSPLITAGSIERGIRAVRSGVRDSALAVVKIQDFLWQETGPLNYDPGCVPRTQDLPPLYMETSGFYVFTRQLVMEHHRRVGFCPQRVEVSPIEALDIDVLQDFWIADAVRTYCMERGLPIGLQG